jgi:hypothetical protein
VKSIIKNNSHTLLKGIFTLIFVGAYTLNICAQFAAALPSDEYYESNIKEKVTLSEDFKDKMSDKNNTAQFADFGGWDDDDPSGIGGGDNTGVGVPIGNIGLLGMLFPPLLYVIAKYIRRKKQVLKAKKL